MCAGNLFQMTKKIGHLYQEIITNLKNVTYKLIKHCAMVYYVLHMRTAMNVQ